MSDIFLSYAREDRGRIKPLADALAQQGWSVFWDLTIPAGKTWHQVIEGELEQARCVIVVWSNASIRSDWVREEAEEGKQRKILIPIRYDDIRPPLGFRSIQVEDFILWDGNQQTAEFNRLTGTISALLGSPPRRSTSEAKFDVTGIQIPIRPDPASNAFTTSESFRDTLRDGGFGPEMVIVPRGTFRMGDISGDGFEYERPVHPVSFAQAFAIGRYAITFEEYDRFAQATKRRLPNDFGWGRERKPVVDVSWEDACVYAQWLSEQTGKPYRLPSEAEWEYAARAGTETAYWWGDEIGTDRANCDGSGSQWSNKQTAPVGSFPANLWGLHDTVGNVWEWVQDRWHGNYGNAPADGSAWEEGGGEGRVLRGGSWNRVPRDARSSYRFGLGPGFRFDSLGFRLVSSPSIIGH